MPTSAELAGYPGRLVQDVDPDDLPESFEWRSGSDLLREELDVAAEKLRARIDDPKGSPLALSGKHDVLVDIAEVHGGHAAEGDGLLAVLRRRSGTGARTG